jgi:hypothetical protein
MLWDSDDIIQIIKSSAGHFKRLILLNKWLSRHSSKYVTFQVLTADSMKMIAFRDTAERSLVVVDRRYGGAYSLHRPASSGG